MANIKSPGWQDLLAGFRQRMQILGQKLTLLRTSETFYGILLPAQSVDPRLDIGQDPREFATLEFERNKGPEVLQNDFIVQANAPFLASEKWTVVRREDSGADFASKFWMVKVVPNVDT